MVIRKAVESDIPKIIAIDHVAAAEEERKQHIKKWVAEENAVVATDEEKVVGYAVLEHTFFFQGFIAMLIVKASMRREGIGTALISYLESQCKTSKIFSSTNKSNRPMQALLAKLSYQQSGIVYNLDKIDPELIYFKRL